MPRPTSRTDTGTGTERALVGSAPGASQLVGFLEPGQLTASTARAVPPARLGAGAGAALWALRIFVLLVGVMVVYTFIAQLG